MYAKHILTQIKRTVNIQLFIHNHRYGLEPQVTFVPTKVIKLN